MTSMLAFFGMPGHIELLIIAGLMLLLFGHRLPKIMRSLGQGIVEFKKGVNDISEDIESASNEKVEEKSEVKSEETAEEKSEEKAEAKS